MAGTCALIPVNHPLLSITMKTNHLLAAVAALLAVMLVLMAVQYSHQLALEDEVAALRAAAFRGGGKTVDTDVARDPVAVGVADSTEKQFKSGILSSAIART